MIFRKRMESGARRAWPVAIAVAGLLLAADAQAQDGGASARCRRTRASAESQAFLLVSPTLWVEGVHVPQLGDETGLGYVVGGEYQLRASLSWSPIDLARGVLLLDQAGTECAQIEAAARARRVLELGEAIGDLPARRAERAVLLGAATRIEELLAHVRSQVEAGVATRSQLASIEAEVLRIARRRAQLDAEIARLIEAGHDEVDPHTLLDDLSAYEASAATLEDQRSALRRLSPFTVSLRGGVVPGDRVDWFGQVQIGVNLGVFAHHVAENDLVAARRDELAGEETELRAHVERLTARLTAQLPPLREELAALEALIALQTRQRELLADLGTSEVELARTLTELSLVGLSAEHARLSTLIDVRTALGTSLHADE